MIAGSKVVELVNNFLAREMNNFERRIVVSALAGLPRLDASRTDHDEKGRAKTREIFAQLADEIFSKAILRDGSKELCFLVGQLVVESCDQEKLTAFWNELTKTRSAIRFGDGKTMEYCYNSDLRDQFVLGATTRIFNKEMLPSILRLTSLALGVDKQQIKWRPDGHCSDWKYTSTTQIRDQVQNFIKSNAATFGLELLFAEIDFIHKAPGAHDELLTTYAYAIVSILVQKHRPSKLLLAFKSISASLNNGWTEETLELLQKLEQSG